MKKFKLSDVFRVLIISCLSLLMFYSYSYAGIYYMMNEDGDVVQSFNAPWSEVKKQIAEIADRYNTNNDDNTGVVISQNYVKPLLHVVEYLGSPESGHKLVEYIMPDGKTSVNYAKTVQVEIARHPMAVTLNGGVSGPGFFNPNARMPEPAPKKPKPDPVVPEPPKPEPPKPEPPVPPAPVVPVNPINLIINNIINMVFNITNISDKEDPVDPVIPVEPVDPDIVPPCEKDPLCAIDMISHFLEDLIKQCTQLLTKLKKIEQPIPIGADPVVTPDTSSEVTVNDSDEIQVIDLDKDNLNELDSPFDDGNNID